MFNAIKYSKELEEAGFTRAQAEVTIGVFYQFMNYNFATKDDYKSAQQSLHMDIADLDNKVSEQIEQLDIKFTEQIRQLDTKFTDQIQQLDTKFTNKFNELDAKFSTEFIKVRSEIKELEYRMTIKLGLMQVTTVAVLAAIIKLL